MLRKSHNTVYKHEVIPSPIKLKYFFVNGFPGKLTDIVARTITPKPIVFR